MTADIDTARLRSEWPATYVEGEVIHRLCTALDAARAELRTVNGCLAAQDENEANQRARAEAAEARITGLDTEAHRLSKLAGHWMDRAVEAEAQLRQMVKSEDVELETLRARIANALAICDRRDQPGPVCLDYDLETEAFRHALTGGTP